MKISFMVFVFATTPVQELFRLLGTVGSHSAEECMESAIEMSKEFILNGAPNIVAVCVPIVQQLVP